MQWFIAYMPTIRRIFFVWLLLQFVVHTRVTFGWWVTHPIMTPIRLRKELLIGCFALLAARLIRHKTQRQHIRQNKRVRRYLILLSVSLIVTTIIQVVILQAGIQWLFVAVKYNFIWFIITATILCIGKLFTHTTHEKFIKRAIRLVKWTLIGALIRYVIIFIKPGTLKLIWYDNFVYEGTVGYAPPAAYYTHLNYGLPRNQFLFERPTTRWFFLVALWPLFFLQFLYRKPRHETRGRRTIYGLNVFLTFSRAARGVRILQTILLALVLYKFRRKHLMTMLLIPIIALWAWLMLVGRETVMVREYSNTGHIAMVIKGREMRKESPTRWHGWWHAWPGSHHHEWLAFNPENQFLQIMIEFGWVGFLTRALVYARIHLAGIRYYYRRHDLPIMYRQWALGAAIWILWLTMSGMVLHSLSDRMVVYPYFLLIGIIYALVIWHTQLHNHTHTPKPVTS